MLTTCLVFALRENATAGDDDDDDDDDDDVHNHDDGVAGVIIGVSDWCRGSNWGAAGWVGGVSSNSTNGKIITPVCR